MTRRFSSSYCPVEASVNRYLSDPMWDAEDEVDEDLESLARTDDGRETMTLDEFEEDL